MKSKHNHDENTG